MATLGGVLGVLLEAALGPTPDCHASYCLQFGFGGFLSLLSAPLLALGVLGMTWRTTAGRRWTPLLRLALLFLMALIPILVFQLVWSGTLGTTSGFSRPMWTPA